MIGVIAKMKARPGKCTQLETVLRAMAKRTTADEPGNMLYQVMRARNEEDVYFVIETYESEEAFKFHMSSGHMAEFRPRLGEILASRPEIIIMDEI